jgi:hypothetical protein
MDIGRQLAFKMGLSQQWFGKYDAFAISNVANGYFHAGLLLQQC